MPGRSPLNLVEAVRRGIGEARAPYGQRRGRLDHRGQAVAIRAALGPEDDAVDVGAHLGDVSRLIASSAPNGRLLAIEPLPAMAASLRSNLPASAVVEECALVGDEPGAARFLHVREHPGYSGLRERDYPPGTTAIEPITVRTERLDDLVARHDLSPRLVKIDVEGGEAGVLRGAAATIERCRPVLLVEHGSAAAGYGETPASFHDLASDLGLRVFDFDAHGPYGRSEFESAVGPAGHFNFLLRP